MEDADVKKFNDIMIDIETFGQGYNAVVVQVAMSYFNRETGEIGDSTIINIDANDSLKYGFEMDKDTLDWWATQPKEVFDSLSVNAIPVEEALANIKKFIKFGALIWCHSTFDAPILGNMYRRVYGANKSVPWGYKNVRDIRTLCDLSKINLELYDWEKEKTHNAGDDVRFQIKYVTDACNMIKYNCSQEQAMAVRKKVEEILAK